MRGGAALECAGGCGHRGGTSEQQVGGQVGDLLVQGARVVGTEGVLGDQAEPVVDRLHREGVVPQPQGAHAVAVVGVLGQRAGGEALRAVAVSRRRLAHKQNPKTLLLMPGLFGDRVRAGPG